MSVRVLGIALAGLAVLALAGRGRAGEKPPDDKEKLGVRQPDDKEKQREQALKFLRAHVIGRTVRLAETPVKAGEGKSEVVVSGSFSYSNLAEKPDGLAFDVKQAWKQTAYDLDKDGKRIGQGKTEESTTSYRYDLQLRKSTGRLVGLSQLTATTSKAPAPSGRGWAVEMEVQDAALVLKESSIVYEDFPAPDGRALPGVIELHLRLSAPGGKLRMDAEETHYQVEPLTLRRVNRTDTARTTWNEAAEKKERKEK